MIMFISIDLSAQRPGRGMNQQRGICQNLPDLTEKQQEEIKDLRLQMQEKSTSHRAKMDELRAKKRSLSLEENPNMNAINSVIDEMSAKQTQHIKDVEQHRQDIRKLLTDEQRVVFDSRPRRGPRGGGKGRPGLNPDCPRGNGQGYGPGQGRSRRQ
jgi:Spy/CpxP family protein refolding chaperone